jgi:elongation factor P
MIKAADIKKGTILQVDNTLYRVATTQYNKPGRGTATMRAQLMDIRTGATQFRVFSAEDNLTDLYVEKRNVKFLYNDGDILHFMNVENYEQYEANTSLFGDDLNYLKDDMDMQLVLFDDNTIIDYQLPTTTTYTVTEAENVAVGNTAGAVLKSIKTETGLSILVPNFINMGDTIIVDTRDKSYVGRG